MSGIDEIPLKLKLIPMPKNKELFTYPHPVPESYFGKVPGYWGGNDKTGDIVCWLKQDIVADYTSDLIVAGEHKMSDIDTVLSLIVDVTSVHPLAKIVDNDFTEKIIKEMRMAYKRTGWCPN